MLENSSPWGQMNHNELKKSIPNEFETLTVAATRKCNANLRISCVAWPTPTPLNRIDGLINPFLKWHVLQKSWDNMCLKPKSQTMSIRFGHVSHGFFFLNRQNQLLFSAGFVGIPKPWWKNCHTSLQEGRTPKAKAKPIPHGVGFEFGICRISEQIHLN